MEENKRLNITFNRPRKSLIFAFNNKHDGMSLDKYLAARKVLYSEVEVVCFDRSMREFYPHSVENWFRGFRKLKRIYGLENFHTKRIKSYRGMFQGCSSLQNINLLRFEAAREIDVTDMFAGCNNLKQVKIPRAYNRPEACLPRQIQNTEYFIVGDFDKSRSHKKINKLTINSF